jgi:hypothetical protein
MDIITVIAYFGLIVAVGAIALATIALVGIRKHGNGRHVAGEGTTVE